MKNTFFPLELAVQIVDVLSEDCMFALIYSGSVFFQKQKHRLLDGAFLSIKIDFYNKKGIK